MGSTEETKYEIRIGADAPWVAVGPYCDPALAAARTMAAEHGGLSYVRRNGEYLCRIENGQPVRFSSVLQRELPGVIAAWLAAARS